MRHLLKTEITIDAPIEEVWAVLIDLDSFPEWNPFMPSAGGVVAEGEQLEVTIRPPGAKGSTVKPRVTELQADRALFRSLAHESSGQLLDQRRCFAFTRQAQSNTA